MTKSINELEEILSVELMTDAYVQNLAKVLESFFGFDFLMNNHSLKSNGGFHHLNILEQLNSIFSVHTIRIIWK